MQGLGSGQQVWSRSGTAGLGALLFVATACAPMHVTLPSALDGGEVLSVSGRGDFGADYRIGAYRVLPRPLGFATSERSDYLISTALARAESFAVVNTTENTLARWAREAVREEGPREL